MPPMFTMPFIPASITPTSQVHNALPYVTLNPPSTSESLDSSAQSNLTTTSSLAGSNIVDKAWYLDSGTTNHFSHGNPLGHGA